MRQIRRNTRGNDGLSCKRQTMKPEDRMPEVLRFRHYSLRTEEPYVGWYRQFVRFHGLRHPKEMGAVEVRRS